MADRVLIDSSFLYALYNRNTTLHQKAFNFAAQKNMVFIVPVITLPEVSFLFVRDIGHHVIEQFLAKFVQMNVHLESLTKPDIERAREIMVTYASAEFDLVDCCIMALSERLNITQICTFDRRDFSMFRPKHTSYLELLPP